MARPRWFLLGSMLLASTVAFAPAAAHAGGGGSYIGQFSAVSTITSTVPGNGDVNPYGVAVVPRSVGNLTQGNILVSNFNAKSNLQGTGTTIVQITPGGTQSLFAQIDPMHLPGACPGGVGLTTALSVLSSGWVIVGSVPTTDGMADTVKAGCLLVLNSTGHVVETISGPGINGPWDMTSVELPGNLVDLFVSNVLNGTVAAGGSVVNHGTILRITLLVQPGANPIPLTAFPVGVGFSERTDPMALVIGPTGLGLGSNGTLYVADSLNNRIAAIPDAILRHTPAGAGHDVSANGALNDPLGLTIAPNGDILSVNGNDGNIVETTPSGTQVATATLDSAIGAGTLFGLAIIPGGKGVYFVDDGDNTLKQLTAPQATIANFAFNPTPITVPAGTTVTWTNMDMVGHTVTADDNSFTSGVLAHGATFSHTFATPGTYTYHCMIHPFMHGTVTVIG